MLYIQEKIKYLKLININFNLLFFKIKKLKFTHNFIRFKELYPRVEYHCKECKKVININDSICIIDIVYSHKGSHETNYNDIIYCKNCFDKILFFANINEIKIKYE